MSDCTTCAAGGAISESRTRVATGISSRPGWLTRLDPTRPQAAIGLVLTVFTFLPNVVAPPKLLWVALGGAIGLLTVSLWRHQEGARWSAAASLVTAYTLTSTFSVVHHGSLTTVMIATAWSLMAVLVVVLSSNLTPPAQDGLIAIVLVVAAVQLLVAIGSTFAGMDAPWGYLGEAGTIFRDNPLAPVLGGRATGTMAHPIPFGALMATAALLSMFGLNRRGLALRSVLTTAFLGGVALSGTRSAAIAFAVSIVFALLIPRAVRHPVFLRTFAVLLAAGFVSLVDVDDLPIFTSLQGTGSFSHRAAALDAGLRLLDRPLLESVAGSGFGSIPDLFTLGYLQLDGFEAVDNQLVASLATAGVLGLVCIVSLVIHGLIVGDRRTRPAALLMFLMFLSFDVLQWYSATILFLALIALGTRPRTSAEPSDDADSMMVTRV